MTESSIPAYSRWNWNMSRDLVGKEERTYKNRYKESKLGYWESETTQQRAERVEVLSKTKQGSILMPTEGGDKSQLNRATWWQLYMHYTLFVVAGNGWGFYIFGTLPVSQWIHAVIDILKIYHLIYYRYYLMKINRNS